MVKGEDLVGSRTLGSRYDHNCIELHDKEGKKFRISCDVILEALKKFNFDTETLRVHTYLYIV